MAGTVVRYSEAFKRQVVSALESGRFRSPFEAATVYGIGGQETVSRWLKQYGRGRLLKKVVRVQSTDEVDQVRRLRREVRELKEALADAHVSEALNRAYLELLGEQTGVDLDSFKKKHAGMRPTGLRMISNRKAQ